MTRLCLYLYLSMYLCYMYGCSSSSALDLRGRSIWFQNHLAPRIILENRISTFHVDMSISKSDASLFIINTISDSETEVSITMHAP